MKKAKKTASKSKSKTGKTVKKTAKKLGKKSSMKSMKMVQKNAKKSVAKAKEMTSKGFEIASAKAQEWMSKLAALMPGSKLDDVVAALKEDHDQLRSLGKTLTSEDATDAEKKEAYKNFSSLLKSHAKSEEKAVYEHCRPVKDLTQEVEEGYVEHHLADGLMKTIATTHDKEKWNALVKVLAEIVEHHADEEEKEMLPTLQNNFEKDEQKLMSHEFIVYREGSQKGLTSDNAGILAELHGSQLADSAKS